MCKTCRKEFSQPSHLEQHKDTHTDTGGNHGNSGLLNIMINPEPTEGRAGKQNSNNALENDSLPKSDLQETRTLRENASQAFENASSLKSEPAEHSTLEVNIGQVLEKDSCLKSEPTEFFCPAVFSNKIITSFFVLPASVSPFTNLFIPASSPVPK